ncbi:MAG: hypothetical protein JWP87_5927 [Labilithrix sp.]|nr:hypothetical protein [Labilithrix sp.]
MCPRCRQNAPIVYRGVNAFCTACGAPRSPLTSGSVNLAGQPSRVGGQITRVFGWIVLVFGTLLAAGSLAMCGAIVGMAAAAPYVLSIPIALATWILSYFLLKGGKQLEQSGTDTQKATRTQAVFALANTRGGMVTPNDLAHAINVTPKEADDILTAMAKEDSDHVSVEVDDNGVIYYRFAAAHWGAIASNPANWERNAPAAPGRMAPNAPAPQQQRSRVAEGAAQNVRVEPRDPIEDELASEPDLAQRHVR